MTGQAQGWALPGVGQAVGELTFVPEDPREKGRERRGCFLALGLQTK